MSFRPPERFNIADYFLDQRVEEGRGDRIALRLDDRQMTYDEVLGLANRFGQVLLRIGVRPEERVLIALPDASMASLRLARNVVSRILPSPKSTSSASE